MYSPVLVTALLVCVSTAQASIYIGCWADSNDVRAIPDATLYTLSGSENHVTCAARCRFLGYEFAAVQSGDECRCANGHAWTRYGARDDSKCDDACPDGTLICGGTYRNSIFTTQLEYVGCVVDNATLSHLQYTDPADNSAERCVTECTDAGYLWAGLSEGSECQCGDALDTSKVIDPANDAMESECDVTCAGQLACSGAELCGGSNRISLYRALS